MRILGLKGLIRPTAFLDGHLVPVPKVSVVERFECNGRQKATLHVHPICLCKMDISLRRTLSASPKGVRRREI